MCRPAHRVERNPLARAIARLSLGPKPPNSSGVVEAYLRRMEERRE